MDDRTELESWTDTAAHAAWLEVRHQAQNAGFEIPPNVRADTVARLHQIITRTLGNPDAPTFNDELAIKAALALAKLSATTTTAVSVQARALADHEKHRGPRDTSEHGQVMERLMKAVWKE